MVPTKRNVVPFKRNVVPIEAECGPDSIASTLQALRDPKSGMWSRLVRVVSCAKSGMWSRLLRSVLGLGVDQIRIHRTISSDFLVSGFVRV